MTSRKFGTLPTGETVEAVSLTNESGASAEILSFGGVVRTLKVPDREGIQGDVVLGFDRLEPYVVFRGCFGAAIGRIAGRVTGGRLLIDGRPHQLSCNEGGHHLHGGANGFDRRLWKIESTAKGDGGTSVTLSLQSPAGDQSYPGNVDVRLTYTLTRSNALMVDTEVTTDQVTPVSLAHHSYFNLAGEGSGTVLDHAVQVLADTFVPINATLTLQDRKEPVEGSPSDWRQPRTIREAILGLVMQHGDFYLLRDPEFPPAAEPSLAARVLEPGSGRLMEVFASDPGLQFYAGCAIGTHHKGKAGGAYGPFDGFCLECHGYPNATTVAGFGDILVRPGTPQRRRTVYAFSTL